MFTMTMTDLNSLSLDRLYDRFAQTGLVRRVIELARDEDLGRADGRGDATSRACIDEGAMGVGVIVARSAGRIAGLRALPTVVELFAPELRLKVRAADGARVAAGEAVAEIAGSLRDILSVERTALNLVGRLSGVATRAGEYVAAAGQGRAAVFDTRKTTPGLRVLEKYAVRCGGGMCHRIGLHDAVLIKDNHLAGVGPEELVPLVTAAVERARALPSPDGEPLAFVELEVESLDQLRRVLEAGGCGVDIVLLDNMTPDQLREAAAMRDRSGLAIELEASGGITLETIGAVAATGVERISVGAMTHHAVWLDMAMDVRR